MLHSGEFHIQRIFSECSSVENNSAANRSQLMPRTPKEENNIILKLISFHQLNMNGGVLCYLKCWLQSKVIIRTLIYLKAPYWTRGEKIVECSVQIWGLNKVWFNLILQLLSYKCSLHGVSHAINSVVFLISVVLLQIFLLTTDTVLVLSVLNHA
jgi:hypothetical protein